MDLSVLPDILSLTVFIVGFRPLVRRVGAYVNLWFLAWTFILVHYVALLFAPTPGFAHVFTTLIALWGTQLCALCFVIAAANTLAPHFGPALTFEMALPVMVQSGLMILYPGHTAGRDLAQHLCCLLFLLPGLHLLLHRAGRSRAMKVLSVSFALFGLLMLPVAGSYPAVVTDGALSLLFLTAAYLYAQSAERVTRGVVAAIVGLTGWGLSYPALAVYLHLHPGHGIDRTLLAMPQYLVVASILLTLLEEHVLRTERMAMHDPLTDLPNRRLFEERLVHTMAEAHANRTTVACLVIDVDNFKQINDTLGHTAGDQLLRALAVRLSWHMSPRDILARTGGDEFTALLAGVNDEHHLRFIASAMMSAASVPIQIDGQSVDVRISVGIALSPDHADDIEDLRRMADEAMYSAKRRGGSILAFAGEG